MPQLVKGGKYIFGWSVVSSDGTAGIPEEARNEYRLTPGETVIILSGSRTSGGIIISRRAVLAETDISRMLERNPDLDKYRIEKGAPLSYGKRVLCWTTILDSGSLKLPLPTWQKYGIQPGDRLLSGRGSYLGLAMLARGPITQEALKHPELITVNA